MNGWTYVATYGNEKAAAAKARNLIEKSETRLDFTIRHTDAGRVNLYVREVE